VESGRAKQLSATCKQRKQQIRAYLQVDIKADKFFP